MGSSSLWRLLPGQTVHVLDATRTAFAGQASSAPRISGRAHPRGRTACLTLCITGSGRIVAVVL